MSIELKSYNDNDSILNLYDVWLVFNLRISFLFKNFLT